MKFVLVAGASGYLGRHVVAALKQQGHRVRALVRQRDPLWKRGTRLAPAVGAEVDEIVMADLTLPQTLQGVCHQIDYVISCVGSARSDNRLTPEQLDHQGNRNLLIEAIRSGAPEKFVYVSMFDKNLPASLPRLQAKNAFVQELQKSVMTSYIVRPNLLYPELLPLLYMAHRGRIWLPTSGTRQLNPIHGADLAAVCVKGLIAKEKEIDVGGPVTQSLEQIARLAFKLQKKPAHITALPPALTRSWLKLGQRQQQLSFDRLNTEQLLSGVAPPCGSETRHSLEAYFQDYLASAFFRP